MTRTYKPTSPPDSAISARICGTLIPKIASPDYPGPDSLSGADPAAEAAALEACQVSAMLASGMLSLTNLTPEAMPRLLHRS